MVYTKTINDNMIINFDYVYHHLLSSNVSLNNQREITLILKRDKIKSISAEVNKKHFKELTKYNNTVIDTTFPRFINLFSSKANLLGRAPYLVSEIGRPGRLSTLSLCLESFRNRTPSNLNFGRKMHPLVNGALCLSTHKHNGKSGTAEI